MEEYVVYLDDMSEGVSALAESCRITNVFPFLSCVAVRSEGMPRYPGGAALAVRAATVSVVMDKAREAVGCPPPAPTLRGGGPSVAVIDTGIAPHVDLCVPCRLAAFVDLVNGRKTPYDDNGHGTSVCGALAGNGLMSGGRYAGIAPDVPLVVIKALGADGEGSTSDILRAMQWVWTNRDKYDIGVVCMSFGAEPLARGDPLAAGAEALHDRGIVVVASSGNDGPSGTVRSPGVSPYVLTVGGAALAPNGPELSVFSSRGVIGGRPKPDLVAPAEDIVCASAVGDYLALTGTSIATPIVAGACAILRGAHPGYTPDKVRELLMRHARPLARGGEGAGHGMLDMSFMSA